MPTSSYPEEPESASQTALDTRAVRLFNIVLGGAIGDAIGLHTEFMMPAQIADVYPVIPNSTDSSYPPFRYTLGLSPPTALPDCSSQITPMESSARTTMHVDSHRLAFLPGSFTDDTDQTLLILLSFLHANGRFPHQRPASLSLTHAPTTVDWAGAFSRRLYTWVSGQGLRALDRHTAGLGRTTKSVVKVAGYEWMRDPVLAAECIPPPQNEAELGEAARMKAWKIWVRGGRVAAPNGAVMRTAIVGALAWKDLDAVSDSSSTQEWQSGVERAMKDSIRLAGTTHADPRCLISCAIVTGLVARMLLDPFFASPPSPTGDKCVLPPSLSSAALHIQEVVDMALSTLRNMSEDSSEDETMGCEMTREELEGERRSRPSGRRPRRGQVIGPLRDDHLQELNELIWAEELETIGLTDRASIGYTYKALACGVWALRRAVRLVEAMQSKPLEAPKTWDELVDPTWPLVVGDPACRLTIFERIVTELTHSGGDADTNCATAAPVAACFLSRFERLPIHWLLGLRARERRFLSSKVRAACSVLRLIDEPYDCAADADTREDGGVGWLDRRGMEAMEKKVWDGMYGMMKEVEDRLKREKEERGKALGIGALVRSWFH